MLQRAFTPAMALVAFFAFFLVLLAVIGPLVRAWAAPHFDLSTTRAQAAFRIAFGLLAQWFAFAVLLLVLKFRGQSPADIGWGAPSALWGWLVALGFVGFFAWSSFRANPDSQGVYALDAHAWLTDWSFFRLSLALGVAMTVGICEETIFRGFVMNQARDAGAPLVFQIALSGVLFGLAHIGTAGIGGRFDFAGTFAAVISTTVFGILFAIAFVLAGRSLTPVIVGHGIFGFIFEPWMVLAIADRAARIHT
jgi:membrane protease YdiL (CAAX protease family)